jgi:hypothetical protein
MSKKKKVNDSSIKSENWVVQCKKSLGEKERAYLLGKILTAEIKDTKSLSQIIRDENCPILFRCAALDRYVNIPYLESIELLDELASSRKINGDLRAQALMWLRNPDVISGERSYIRTLGSTTSRGKQTIPEENWRIKAADDPSARVRWLTTLSD